jgi:hypothetical protein
LPDCKQFALLGISQQSKVINPASNQQPGGPGLCIYVPPVTG